MTFISRILRFLFWLLVVSWSVRLLRRIVVGMLSDANAAPPQSPQAEAVGADDAEPGAAGRLVRDPVCGMHVAEALSIPLRDGNEVLYFCSTACRDKYALSAQKLAANG